MDSPQIARAMLSTTGGHAARRTPRPPHVTWLARLLGALDTLARARARFG